MFLLCRMKLHCLPVGVNGRRTQDAGDTDDLSDDSEQEDKDTEQYREQYDGDDDDVSA